ncbi:MAG: photosystem II stability/assembly factor-like uncharacterized protein [Paracoccaceae bacterium]|jgi:photosystem II stability/assembly factor-like uncharacterized protein
MSMMQSTITAAAALFACASVSLAQVPTSPLLDSFEQYVRSQGESEFGLQWVPLGPVLNSGRVEAVQGDPDSPGTMFAAFGSGNLWKTVNAGLTWRPIFEGQSALGIGDIALAPSDSNVLWLGSGESLKKPRNFTMPGTGVFLSRDAGETWANVGLHDSWHIGEVAVHPEDPGTALVAVLGHFWSTNPNRGVYRTNDWGQTWEHVLFIDERTGACDVVIAPSQPDVVYASMWTNHPGESGPTSGVHRSADGGRTWVRLAGGLPDGPRTGRIGLAVSWTNPDKVYALVDNLNREENPAELYRTLDGGQSWERTHEEDLQVFSRIGWYFADCHVNPLDDDEVYALGVRIAHSRDGGGTFDLIGGEVFHLVPSPAESLHLDNCEMWIDPAHPERLILGNDGGIFVSHDRGQSWLHHNNLAVGEFYDIAVDDQDPYQIYGGVQDDASVRGPAREMRPGRPDSWKYVWLDPWSGGDGCYTVPDREDPNTVYFSSQHGGLRRQDVSTGRSKSIRPRLPDGHEGRLQHSFVAPYLVSAHDHRALYHGGNYVLRSPDRGDTWQVISPDFTRSASGAEGAAGVGAGALAESPIRQGLLYCGTDLGGLWVTEDDGLEWRECSTGLPPHYIRSVCPSRFSESRLYVAVTGLNHDDLHAYLYASEDHGKTWRPIMEGLPDEVAYTIIEDPRFEDVLYAGMYRGVYVSTDRGASWSLLGRGMPGVAISDLVIQERELDLLAATHGRGVYRLDLTPLHRTREEGGAWTNALLETPTAYLPRVDDTVPRPRRTFEERVPITFTLTRAAPVTLAVLDDQGGTVWSQEIAGRVGLNQLRWDLVKERRTSPKPYFTGHVEFVKPGSYELLITGDELRLKGKLDVVAR